jgi:arabinose-5-phosphate isomerase
MSSLPQRDDAPLTPLEALREGRAVLQREGEALLDLSRRLDAAFCAAIDLLAACRGSVIVAGVGKAGLIGRKIAATLASTGARAWFLHPTEALHGDLGCLHPDDTACLLSYSGETEEICKLIPIFKRLGMPTLAITASTVSTLGRQAEVTLPLGRLVEAGAHGLAPTTSTTAMLAIGDALAMVLCLKRRFTPHHFAAVHPGGSLGRRLAMVVDVMRSGPEIRIAAEDKSVRDVFVGLSRPGRRTGAVMLVDEDGRLTGLFTDSDLARLLEQRRDADLDRPIREVMTARPLTIAADAILEEALQLLGVRRLSELPVIDADHRPIGLVDITDVIGLVPAREQAPGSA